MNPFEPGGGVIPPAPIDIPIPEIPQANFTQIGTNIAAGAKAGGFWDDWIKALVGAVVDIVTNVVGGLLGLVELALSRLIAIVFKTFQAAEFGTDDLAATVIGGMTGLPVSQGTFSAPKNRGARDDLSASIVSLLTDALAKGATKDASGQLQPSQAGADEFLKLITHMGLEGWWLGTLADAFSWHKLEHLGDIKEVIEETLGLGRLARRALSAPMKILVEEPYTWKLNKAYLPTRLAAAEYIRQYLRTNEDRATLGDQMAELGHASKNVETLIAMTRQHLAPAQITDLLFHKQLDHDTAVTLLRAQGYDQATAELVILQEQNSRLDGFARKQLEQAFVNYDAHIIDRNQMQAAIDNSGLPEIEKNSATAVLAQKAFHNRRLLSLAQGEQLVKHSIWNFDQFRQLATAHGYSLDDETSLELLLLLEQKQATDAATAKAAAAKLRADNLKARQDAAAAKVAHATEIAEAHGVSIARYESLVLDGLRTIAQYRGFLIGKGIAGDNIDAFATVLQAKLDKASHGATITPALAAAAKQKQLDLSQLEKAVLGGHISKAEYQSRITALGFDAADVAVLVELLQDRIDAAALKGSAKTAVSNALKARGLSLAAEERATRLGLQTIAQYSAFLDKQGFAAEDRDLLVHLMQAQLVSDDQARAVRGEVSGQMQAKGLSLHELEQSVRAGVRTVDDYKLQLSKVGYDAATQEALLDLLNLHMQQDQASVILHGHAAARLGEIGLSLSELEGAVKQGVKTLSDYADALTQAGYSPADVDALRLTLAAKYKLDPGPDTGA